MIGRGKTNFERFLECSSPRVPIQYYTQREGSSSSSSLALGAIEEEEVRKPRIVLGDIWSACADWSADGLQVPLSLENFDSDVKHHYLPSLSAIQIFTIKPFSDDSRSSAIEIDATETGSAKPESDSNFKPRFSDDHLGYLYFQYDEITLPFKRTTLTFKMEDLAAQHTGLSSLTSSDLSPYSWISIAWYPIYPIPSVRMNGISAAFLTYHLLTPNFPETIGKDDKGNEQGGSSTAEVLLPPFGAVTYKAFGDMWIMPGTSDYQKREMHEESASSWLQTRGFSHSDFSFFMSHKFNGGPY
ncbi:unnamed protein product [Arabidopsis lyrata]|uniref:Uncharacterized protein n=1 Tax=Arabidopsis lyrata subsp. lyrata TaxID=81972 RepID=D7M291_ARALL|nr:uncharacterized protein LOC9310193 [Arabidopsis lyrata subsp. lyrata]EFH48314.1 hypothetical protein ARALYDRAFT_489199 [Arabidopsis lyrata subsp. lyrata]CAH8271981.1 unnamed protein product [Arabidopsis lyrata]|eukprot:XP_020877437.1 uncharacterized protein LOC9310193 [Arabidopsis lyrata subsp. lyrata]